MILFSLGIYVLVAIGAVCMTGAIHFWILCFLVGLVMGGTQALSRSLFGAMVFDGVGHLLRSSQYGAISLVFFFVVGGLILFSVP